MIQVTHMEVISGVHLTAVHTAKFKSSFIGVQLLTPLCAETAAANALIPAVLRRGTEQHPDMQSIAAALDELYGGALEPMVRRKGETQCVGFIGSFLDDAYTLDGEKILEPATALMGQLLLHPVLENGRFVTDYVEGERANLIDRIRAQINDKRQYALNRVIEEMCSDEPFGVDKLGSEQSAAAITAEKLWTQYQKLLQEASIELYYCGSATPERVRQAFMLALEGLSNQGQRSRPGKPVTQAAPPKPKMLEQSMDITQGKLTIGFRTGEMNVWSEAYPALLMANAIYGGTTTSKLFLNVREKLSLCYYASAQLEKLKGVMLVSSGVEFSKVQEAQAEIFAQLDACKRGAFEEWELEGARRSIVSSLMTALDSQGRLEDFWLGQAVAGLGEGPEQLAARVEQVTREQVVKAAADITPDTIYFLRGKKA